MGSVQQSIECPHCKFSEAFSDYYYKTDEEYIFCPACGYNLSISLDREKLKAEGIILRSEIREEHYIRKEIIPVCGIHQSSKTGFGSLGTVDTGTVEDVIADLRSDRDNIMSNPTFENIVVSWYKDGKFYKYDLVKNVTEDVTNETITPELDSAGFDKDGNSHYDPKL